MENRSIIQKLCSVVAGRDEEDESAEITRDEATDLFHQLLRSVDLKKQMRNIIGDRRPSRVVSTERYALHFEVFGHTGVIDRVCFDHSGEFIFTGGADGIIKIWSIREGMLIHSLYGHCSAINDICLSQDGEYLVAVDSGGLLNIWMLKSFKLLHSLPMNSEIIFCEFIRDSLINTMSIIFILSTGIVTSLRFSDDAVLETKSNSFMSGENFKAICVTDGGRFVMCGTWLPYLLVYDTHSLGSIIVMDKYKVQSICAAKGCLKFAASSENKVYTYTFFQEGDSSTGNFKKRKGCNGYWKRTTNLLPPSVSAERICFLASYLLAVTATDGIIRIYDDGREVISMPGENGCIYAHPTRDVFVITGINLSFYEITRESPAGEFQHKAHSPFSSENKVYITRDRFGYESSKNLTVREGYCITMFLSDNLLLPANDCVFSDDGRYFVISNDHGVIRAYSTESPASPPCEQFFASDFSRRGSGELANYEYTVGFNQVVNPNWRKMKYATSPGPLILSEVSERLAAKYLEKEHIDQAKFNELFLARDDIAEAAYSDSSDDATWDFSSSSDSSENDDYDSSVSYDDNGGWISESSEEESIRLTLPKGFDSKRRIVSDDENEKNDSKILLRKNIDRTGKELEMAAARNEAGAIRLRRKAVSDVQTRKRRSIVDSDDIETHVGGESTDTHIIDESTGTSVGSDSGAVRGSSSKHAMRGSSSKHARSNKAATGGYDAENESAEGSNDTQSDDIVTESSSSARTKKAVAQRKAVSERFIEDIKIRRSLPTAIIHEESPEKLDYVNEWLKYFRVYKDETVYFDADEYKAFLKQDDRFTGPGLPTGYYKVLSMEIIYLGKLPYASIGLANNGSIKFYEYEGSYGILCTREQHEASGKTSINREVPVKGRIEAVDGLSIRIQDRWYFRSHILKGANLRLLEVPYDNACRSMFGRIRHKDNKTLILEVFNYDVINQRIRACFYKSKAQFMSDLAEMCRIANALFPAASKFCKEIFDARMRAK